MSIRKKSFAVVTIWVVFFVSVLDSREEVYEERCRLVLTNILMSNDDVSFNSFFNDKQTIEGMINYIPEFIWGGDPKDMDEGFSCWFGECLGSIILDNWDRYERRGSIGDFIKNLNEEFKKKIIPQHREKYFIASVKGFLMRSIKMWLGFELCHYHTLSV